jgi:hypothetical protein
MQWRERHGRGLALGVFRVLRNWSRSGFHIYHAFIATLANTSLTTGGGSVLQFIWTTALRPYPST